MSAYAALVTDQANKLTDLEVIFGRLLSIATALAGVVIFVMLGVGAFQLLTAGANQEKVQQAQRTFGAAAVGAGLLIVIWLLLRFIEEFTGVNVTDFRICFGTFSGPNCQ